MVSELTPSQARSTLPLFLSCGRTFCAVSIGTANPMPTLPLPLPPVSICELMPITRPAASSSGPPELPGLIGASVCRTFVIVKPLGAVIWRCSAEITPVVSVRSRLKGLPIASTGSPTLAEVELPSVSGCSVRPSGRMRSTARSLEGSLPTTFASTVLPRERLTVTLTAFSTTCQLVRIVPSESTTMPEPVACPRCCASPPPKRPNGDSLFCTIVEVTNTTPGASRT